MFFDQRVLYSANGVFTDISQYVNEFVTSSYVIPYKSATDYIYIGTIMPWSARWIEMAVVNDQANAISVDLWDNTQWRPAVDVFDLTQSSGASLGQSGYLRFLRNRDFSWTRNAYSWEIPDLSSTDIWDLHWMRLSWSADFNVATAIKYMGMKFSTNEALYARYPDLNQAALLARFAAGKTSWDEQHFIAASIILSDLKNRRMILSADQILDPWAFERASVHKVAEIIYASFGEAYQKNKDAAEKEYAKEMNNQYKNLDSSGDGTLSLAERRVSFGTRVR